MKKQNKGFTLLEMVITLAIAAILTYIAHQTYERFSLKKYSSQAQQEMIKLSINLEQHKSSNFTYKNFSTASISTPISATTDKKKYTIDVVDTNTSGKLTATTAQGGQWAIKATPKDPKNYTILLNSYGTQCKNKSSGKVTYISCGKVSDGSEVW